MFKNYEQLKEFYSYVESQLTLDDYEDLLYTLGVEQIKKSSSEWHINSICHNIEGGGLNLRFYLESRTFYCFSGCDESFNIFTLIQKRHNVLGTPISSLQSLKYVCQYKRIPFNGNAPQVKSDRFMWEKKDNLGMYLESKDYDSDLTIYDDEIIDNLPMIYHTNFLDSGITLNTLNKYNVRYYPTKSQIVMPCYDIENNLIGIRVRNMDEDKDLPKYCPFRRLDGLEYKFSTNKNFYGINHNASEIKRTGEVWLVESERSVLIADSWFGDKSKALALYGSSFKQDKLNILFELEVTKVIIFLDSDFKETTGDEFNKFTDKVNKIKDVLKEYVNEIYVVYNNIGMDMYKENAFDVGKKGFKELWKNMEKLK